MVHKNLKSITSSYDFDAPLNEAGDPTEKYWKIQNVISKYNDIPSGPQPIATPKKAYGKYTVSNVSCLKLFERAAMFLKDCKSFPLNFFKSTKFGELIKGLFCSKFNALQNNSKSKGVFTFISKLSETTCL